MPDPISNRVLNRTLLRRQLLLERADLPPLDALEHLVGLQAQLPLDPYYALWSRLDGFDPNVLGGHVERREAVRLVVMRGTLHLVTQRDARTLWPRMEPVLVRIFGGQAGRREIVALPDGGFEAFRAEGRRLLSERPMPNAELADRVGERFPETSLQGRRSMTYVLSVVQIPPRGVWGKTLRPTWANLDEWVGRPLLSPIPLQTLVRRYLAAFGPASVTDFQNWSRLPGMRETFEGMRKRLRTYRAESGRELFDLPDAALASGAEPAPVRFLPTYDNVLLGHDDRSRIVPAEQSRSPFFNETRNVGSVLVDGMVSACWTTSATKTEAVLVVETLRRLTTPEQAEVSDEGYRLLEFEHPALTHDVVFRPYQGPPAST